ncbi:MAG: ATP-dependent helicase [Bacteroidia bacterium]|nr:ATP-dependent helicase [Bacteroidia bacterium]
MELLVYKASAGSGKTFTLAVEYIKLLIQNPKAYRQILAVTFTNKATAEMKERILSQLHGIHIGDQASVPYLKKIEEETGLTNNEIRLAAGNALTAILHDYSRFRVETIDSFFQTVMRNLARELELSPNLNIELDNAQVLSDAVDSLIEKLGPKSPVLAWLLDYIDERIADDKRWNVSDEVKNFGRNIFDEGYIEKGDGLRERLKSPDSIKSYRKELKELEKAALEQMAGFSERFEKELDGRALQPDDLKNSSKGIGSYFRKLKSGLIDEGVRNVTVEKCLESAENWTTKSSSRRKEILELAESRLIPLLEDAERYRPKNNKIVNSCRLSLQHLNKVQLLANIDEEVRLINREHNRFLLSDTNALLHRLVKEGDSSFVFEKIGTNIGHIMIDEFQDTSKMQWDNFKLLLIEGLSKGANSLIVGDVKQSIYRWRNGDWGILNGLKTRIGHFPIREKTLTTNRRSEARVIQFNNRVFEAAVTYLNGVHRQELGVDCDELQRAYSDVAQESPQTTERGYVKVEFIEPDEELSYPEQTLKCLGEEVSRLLAADVKLNDIAILVRKNKNIPPIADYFDKVLHLKVVSDEAFRLDASLAVNLLVMAVRYLSNPKDRAALAQLALSYRNEVLQEATDWNGLLLEEVIEQYLPKAFLEQQKQLALMPLYELFEELFVCFELSRIEQQEAYMFAFFDAVTTYVQNHSSDRDLFLTYWEETLCKKTIPSGEVEGIRIFSIHKSKGLEFHTVLLPFCDWKLENETNNQLVWCVPEDQPFNGLDIVPVNYSSQMAESIYRPQYLNERLQLWVDNLNLLYVAFTRTGKNLIIWSKADQKRTMSELLSEALGMMMRQEEADWDGRCYEVGELCASEVEKVKVSANCLTQQAEKIPVRMESIRPQIEFLQSNRSADFIKGVSEEESDNRFINRGQLLHTLFSAIEKEEDIDAAIEALLFEGVIGSCEQAKEIRELTHQAFATPEVQTWYSGEWTLFNECAIIFREKGVLQTRRPDRVMMKADEVVVVDFKFGKPKKKYNKQVEGYMALLRQMGYKNITGYLWYVDEELIEQV